MQACLHARREDPRVWRDAVTMLESLGEPARLRCPACPGAFRCGDPARLVDLAWPGPGTGRRLDCRRRILSPVFGAQPWPAWDPLPAGPPRKPPWKPGRGRRIVSNGRPCKRREVISAPPLVRTSMPLRRTLTIVPSCWRRCGDWPQFAVHSAGRVPLKAGAARDAFCRVCLRWRGQSLNGDRGGRPQVHDPAR